MIVELLQKKGAEHRPIYRKLPKDIFIELQRSVLFLKYNITLTKESPKTRQAAKAYSLSKTTNRRLLKQFIPFQ
jgi:hypothetical protein